MIDLHCHLLPDLDDGVRTLEEGVELARDFVAEGISVAVVTPHVRDDFPTTVEAMDARLQALRAALAADAVQLEVLGGGEISLGLLERLTSSDLTGFSLGGRGRHVLLEFPYDGWPLALAARAAELLAEGLTPVLAHPERNPDVQTEPRQLTQLVSEGVLVQLTAASLTGLFGKAPRAAAFRLLDLGLAQLVSSDAHGPGARLTAMAGVEAALGDADLAQWLTSEAPRAILDGQDPPPRPLARGRPWRARLRAAGWL